jgi:hypothetical protein
MNMMKGIPLCVELLENTVYDNRQGQQVNITNETPLYEELLETKTREEEKGEDDNWDGEGARRKKVAGGRRPLADGRWPGAVGRGPLAGGRWPVDVGWWLLASDGQPVVDRVEGMADGRRG